MLSDKRLCVLNARIIQRYSTAGSAFYCCCYGCSCCCCCGCYCCFHSFLVEYATRMNTQTEIIINFDGDKPILSRKMFHSIVVAIFFIFFLLNAQRDLQNDSNCMYVALLSEKWWAIHLHCLFLPAQSKTMHISINTSRTFLITHYYASLFFLVKLELFCTHITTNTKFVLFEPFLICHFHPAFEFDQEKLTIDLFFLFFPIDWPYMCMNICCMLEHKKPHRHFSQKSDGRKTSH